MVNEKSLCFAPDLCYAMVQSFNAGFTEYYVSKYNPATNALDKKATQASVFPILDRWTYDASHKLFVGSRQTDVVLYDPITETIDVFASGISSGVLSAFVYVPSLTRVYGLIGTDGSGLSYVGYVDIDLRIVVALGTIPAVGASKPKPANLVYVPSTNCLYGCWITGLGAGMAKFDLATNIGTPSVGLGGIDAVEICLDTDRNLIIASFSNVKEFDPNTELIVRTTPITAGGGIRFTPHYVSSLKKVIGCGVDTYLTGNDAVLSYSTFDYSSMTELNDYEYLSVEQFKDGSFISDAYNAPKEGVRRLCLT